MADHIENAEPHFTISAAVVKQLGEELVSDEVTAIMELVKNSYDAKATYVIVEINNKEKFQSNLEVIPQSTVGYVIITDNGIGMSSNDVYSKWLTISMSEKRKDKLNNKFSEKDRTPLGEKGVGRLSTQRIGDIVDLITGVKKEEINSHISFKWSDFNESTTLDKVKINASNYTKILNEQGTKIIVRDLRDLEVWQGVAFNRILGELSQLILPGSTKGFKVYLKQNDNPINIEDITTKVQQNAICSYSFDYSQNSGLKISGKIKLLKLRGNKASDYEIYSKIIEQDNGKSFFDFLTNKTLNSKEFIDKAEYIGKEGFLFKFEKNIDNPSLDLVTVPVKDKEIVVIGNLEEKKNYFNKPVSSGEDSIKRNVADPGPFKGQIYEFSFVSSPLQNTFDSFASV